MNMKNTTNQFENVKQAVICGIFTLAFISAMHIADMSLAFAEKDKLPPEIQVDILMASVKKKIEAKRWQDALHGLEKALRLGVKLPGEFHFYYGKTLYMLGNYDGALSSLISYLTLTGRDGEYYKEAVTLVVDAENGQGGAGRQSSGPEQQQTKAAGETDDGMVYIKGGCFDMGDIFGDGESDEKPVHTVCVSDFYLGKTEVTQRQWIEVMGRNPAKFKNSNSPVEKVSWNNIQDFIKKLNKATGKYYRLPTEAEWEYAARNGGGREKWAGTDKESELDEYAWFGANSRNKGTHAIAGKKPNGLGLYDMMGNVWEWCSDRYGKNYYKGLPAKDPEGPSIGLDRVLRGGGWKSKPGNLRTVNRNNFAPTSNKFANIGFRLARSP